MKSIYCNLIRVNILSESCLVCCDSSNLYEYKLATIMKNRFIQCQYSPIVESLIFFHRQFGTNSNFFFQIHFFHNFFIIRLYRAAKHHCTTPAPISIQSQLSYLLVQHPSRIQIQGGF